MIKMKLLYVLRCSEPSNRIDYTAPFNILSGLTPTFLDNGVEAAFFVLGMDDYEGKDPFGQPLKVIECDTNIKHAQQHYTELGIDSYEHDGVSKVFPKLDDYIEKIEPDVILAFTPLFAEIFALRESKRKIRTPIINYCGSTPVMRETSHGGKVSGFEILAENKAMFDRHVAISHCTNKYLTELGIEAEVIYAGINPDQYQKDQTSEKEKTVMYSGRFHIDKGTDLVPDIIRRVIERDDDARFVIAGYGPMHDELAQKLMKLNGKIFLETLDNDDLREAYCRAHTYFKPSRANESFCVSVVEAMAAGNNIIYSDLEGIALREIVGDAGVPVSELDPELYAEGIIESLKNRQTPNQTTIERVRERFDIRKKAGEWITLLKNL